MLSRDSRPRRRMRAAWLLALSMSAAACASDRSSLTGPTTTRSLSLSFATRPVIGTTGQVNVPLAAGSVAPPSVRASSALLAVTGADTLVITRVQLVLSRVELTRSTGVACDDDSASPDCSELERHFVLVDLPTDTSVHTVLGANIPPGSYTSLEARLRIPRSSDDTAATTFLAAHPEFAGANVRVEGTFRGAPFTFTGATDSRVELAFSPPIVVDSTGANITVHVDVTTWFRDQRGALIGPASANAGGVNAALVADNIRRSFRAVRDDAHDGHDDGGRHGHGG